MYTFSASISSQLSCYQSEVGELLGCSSKFMAEPFGGITRSTALVCFHPMWILGHMAHFLSGFTILFLLGVGGGVHTVLLVGSKRVGPGVKPLLPAAELWSLNHWPSREVPGSPFLFVSALLPACLDRKVYASLFQYGEYWLLLLSPAFSWVNAVCSADALVVTCAFGVSPKNPLPDPSSKVDTHVFFSEFYSFSFYI